MRRLILFLCLIAVAALPARAAEFRFPQTGKHAFLVDLPKGWHSETDAKGGLLLIPPADAQHAMLYLGIIVDDSLRGKPLEAVAAAAAKSSGVESFDKQEPARITDAKGAVHRGTAFYGKVLEKKGHFRKAKIVIIPLGDNTWAQTWIVTQPGMGYVEYNKFDTMLSSLTLAGD
ncbi:MAG: hypothetical protein ACXWJ8_10915 [Xanthobacteraceae bacterium]